MQITRVPKRHLDSSELVDATRACPVCRSSGPRRAGFRVQSDPDVHMLACRVCRAASASHMPTDEVLASFYASFYDDRDREITFSAPERFAKHVTGILPRARFDGSVRILDYGGGDGSLAKAIASRWIASGVARGADILVIDFATRAPSTEGAVRMRSQSPDAAIDDAYDLVLASAILEHIPDLQPVIARLYAAMAANGFFYARTPFVLPLGRMFPRLDLAFPAHVHDLGSDFWNRFPATFGWDARIVASRPSVIAGSLANDPLRTLAAAALKAPAHVENWLSSRKRAGRLWNLVGGWEVVLQKQ